MSREYPANPVPAVGTFVISDARVLLVRRRNPPHAGEWSIPGGKQELAEGIYEAARREVEEETSLTVRDLCLFDVGDIIEHDDEGRVAYHYTLIYFLAQTAGGRAVAADDASAVRWVTLAEAERIDLSPTLLQLLKRAFTSLSGE